MRLLSLIAIIFACIIASPGGASARPRGASAGTGMAKGDSKSQRTATSKSKSGVKAKAKSKSKRRKGGRGRRDKLPNLPRGWAWPPTGAMRDDGARCVARLGALGVAHRVVAEETPKVATPVEVAGREIGGVRFECTKGEGRALVMDCRFAEAMAVVGAPILRALGVRALRYSSLHIERGVILRGRKRRILSRHALGLAIDVFAVVGDGGEAHVVRTDYRRSALLREIERRLDESGAFRRVLTPGKDRKSHYDHFHIEARTLGDGAGPPEPAPPISR